MTRKFPRNKTKSNANRPFPPQKDTSDNKKFPVWTFRNIDRDGKFAFNPMREDFDAKDFLSKMISYSNMTWQEILRQTHDNGKSKHHSLSNIEALSKEARDCIKKKNFEDSTDALFSFALNNTTRVIGFRDGEEFQVVWYDTNHEFAISILKNT